MQSQNLIDADTPDTVRLTPAEATDIGVRALERIGYSGEDARIIVDQLVDNALCGYKFAGLPRILAIAGDEKTRQARKPVKVIKETPLSALLDGGNNVGYIVAYRAAEIAIRKAREHGMASVGAYNSYYSGRNAYFVDRIAREGLVAFHIASAKPRVLPPGAARPALGTNPLCFGFPSDDGPVMFDMGTASLMWGDVMLHERLGLELPEGIGFDETGHPTRDPSATLRGGVGTFGGYKGYGLSFAVQALGLLAGAHLARGEVAGLRISLLGGRSGRHAARRRLQETNVGARAQDQSDAAPAGRRRDPHSIRARVARARAAAQGRHRARA